MTPSTRYSVGQELFNGQNQNNELQIIEEELLPPVNEFKRFVKVFLKRKIVFISFILVILTVVIALFAETIAPYDPNQQDLYNVLAPPSREHLLGTDSLGRDLLSRIIFGSRVALSVGVITVLISAAIGTLIGLVAGYAEGVLQPLIMRITDAMMAIPSLILALIVASILNRGVIGVVIAVAITLFPGYIRLINGQVLSVKQNDYVLAGRSMGSKNHESCSGISSQTACRLSSYR